MAPERNWLREDVHPEPDALELYALGRISEDDSILLEEHLLVCPECQLAVQQTDAFARALRQAEERRIVRESQKQGGSFEPKIPRAAFAVAATAAVIAVVATGPLWQPRPESAELTALRDGSSVEVSANRPLELKLNAAGLPDSPSGFEVEVAAANGMIVQRRVSAPVTDRFLRFQRSSGLAPGGYWIRIYGQDGLLREFQVSAR
jgi:anti-sigma factor RsiW